MPRLNVLLQRDGRGGGGQGMNYDENVMFVEAQRTGRRIYGRAVIQLRREFKAKFGSGSTVVGTSHPRKQILL